MSKIEKFAKAVAVVETFQRHPLPLNLDPANISTLADWFDKADTVDIENELDEIDEHKFVLSSAFEDSDFEAIDILQMSFKAAKKTLEAFEKFKAS